MCNVYSEIDLLLTPLLSFLDCFKKLSSRSAYRERNQCCKWASQMQRITSIRLPWGSDYCETTVLYLSIYSQITVYISCLSIDKIDNVSTISIFSSAYGGKGALAVSQQILQKIINYFRLSSLVLVILRI